MASLNDKITDARNGARPNTARVAVARVQGGTELSCNNLTGWPTDSKVHFVVYSIDTNDDPVPGTQIDCQGIVSSNTITSMQVLDGTDNGNSIGQVVEMLPTASWGQDLADGLMVSHDRDGSLKDGAVDSASVLGSGVVSTAKIADSAVTTGKLADDSVTAAKLDGIDKSLLTTDSNPYKFSAYANSSAYTSDDPIFFANEIFDTNNNHNTSNGRWTVPVTGFYWVNAAVGFSINGNANTGYQVYLNKNSSTTVAVGVRHVNMYSGAYSVHCTVSKLLYLTAGDYITVHGSGSGGAGTNNLNGNNPANTYFEAFLVSRT